MLVVLTLIGVAVTRQTSTDIQIAGNMIPYKQDFYVAQGGVAREVAELNRGSYPITALEVPQALASDTDTGLPTPAHEVNGAPYQFDVRYIGHYKPPAGSGYSIIKYSRYDYEIDSRGGNAHIVSRAYSIGPKAE
jgi:hypothetical protein